MTKPAGTPRKKPEPRRRNPDARCAKPRMLRSQERLASLVLSPPSLRNDNSTVLASNARPTPPESATAMIQSGADPARSFYLGSTSYAAVFNEDCPLPDSVHEQPPERVRATPSRSSRTVGHRHCQFNMGGSIVSSLTPFSVFEKSAKMYFETHRASALIGPLVLSALPQLCKDLKQLVAAGSDAYLLYVEMTRNTARSLKVPTSMLPSEFHTLFTGKNLRWEILGLVLAIAGSNAQFILPDDPIFTLEDGSRLNKDEFIEDMIHAANDCINICQIHGAVNDSTYHTFVTVVKCTDVTL